MVTDEEPAPSPPGLNHWDDVVIAASGSTTKRRNYVENSRHEALMMLDGLRWWLQYQDTSHHPLWRSAVYLLRDIAQKIHSWPPSLVITGIVWQGEGGVQPQRSDLHGSFGEVFRAKLQDDQRVAAKRLYLRTDNEKFVYREVVTWSALRHDDLLPLLGVFVEPDQRYGSVVYMISPWMDHGNLSHFVNGSFYNPAVNRRSLAQNIATGLAYLHSRKIVHGDICPENILVNAHMKAKIGDFGGATIGEDTALRDLTSRRHGGHVGYRSPEFIQDTSSRRLPPNDVFSYGSVCYFLCTGKRPYDGWTDFMVNKAVAEGRNPIMPKATECKGQLGLTEGLGKLIGRCWTYDYMKRLTMTNVLAYYDRSPERMSPDGATIYATAKCTRAWRLPLLRFKAKEGLRIFAEIDPGHWLASNTGGKFGAVQKSDLSYLTLFDAIVNHLVDPGEEQIVRGVLNLTPGAMVHVILVESTGWLVKTEDQPATEPNQPATLGEFGILPAVCLRPLWTNISGKLSWTPMTVLYNRKSNVLRSELELKAEAKVDVLQTPGIVEPAWHIARAPSNILGPGGSVQYDYGVVPANFLAI